MAGRDVVWNVWNESDHCVNPLGGGWNGAIPRGQRDSGKASH